MSGRFHYTTYVRASRETVWDALTDSRFTQAYWFGTRQESEWQTGAKWSLVAPDGRIADSGTILEATHPGKLVILWIDELHPSLRDEGPSRVSYILEEIGSATKLTVIQEIEKEQSNTLAAMSEGWPHLLASLKTLLETGTPLAETRDWPKGL